MMIHCRVERPEKIMCSTTWGCRARPGERRVGRSALVDGSGPPARGADSPGVPRVTPALDRFRLPPLLFSIRRAPTKDELGVAPVCKSPAGDVLRGGCCPNSPPSPDSVLGPLRATSGVPILGERLCCASAAVMPTGCSARLGCPCLPWGGPEGVVDETSPGAACGCSRRVASRLPSFSISCGAYFRSAAPVNPVGLSCRQCMVLPSSMV